MLASATEGKLVARLNYHVACGSTRCEIIARARGNEITVADYPAAYGTVQRLLHGDGQAIIIPDSLFVRQ